MRLITPPISSNLDAKGHTWLDYSGAGLYRESPIRTHDELPATGVFDKSHSHNPNSLAATRLIDEARAAVLDF